VVIGQQNITAGQATRVAPTQQGNAAAPVTPKVRQSPATPAADQYRPAPLPIIEAEYVDLYSPVRSPIEQLKQWQNMIIEEDRKPGHHPTKSDVNGRHLQLIARYEQHSSDLPSPGSFVNLMV